MKKYIGLDAGSVSVKLAVMDSNGNILKTEYIRSEEHTSELQSHSSRMPSSA